jgi:hypothetical protein
MSLMSLATRPQSLMSARMSFSLMCCARPRTIIVLLGATLRSTSSSLLQSDHNEWRNVNKIINFLLTIPGSTPRSCLCGKATGPFPCPSTTSSATSSPHFFPDLDRDHEILIATDPDVRDLVNDLCLDGMRSLGLGGHDALRGGGHDCVRPVPGLCTNDNVLDKMTANQTDKA